MRWLLVFMLGMLVVGNTRAQDAKTAKLAMRYGIEVDLVTYPQATPKDALASVLKAIEAGKINYLLAHLADPDWVDQQVKKDHNGQFEVLVKETTEKIANDRTSIKELRRFLQEGTWETTDTTATAQLKNVKNRRVYMRKREGRWFLENSQEVKKEK
ncbi:MAG TPA: hypothetical protein VGY77_09225 [Gemmataceae bacterium]|nr:hypothetical protein [Gemmataceae bacterium]